MPRQPITIILRTLFPVAALAAVAIAINKRNWAFLCIIAAILACLPPLLAFERKQHESGNESRTLALIAVMSVLTALSRTIFSAMQHFKPVTALIIITAIYFGANAGFSTGALAAILSGLFGMGLGPWTPFQMLAWGFIGLLAGLLARPLLRNRLILCLFAAISGMLFSLITDVFTVLWMADSAGNTLAAYTAVIITSLPIMGIYAVSNILFLLLFGLPLGRIFTRIKRKYGWT